MELSDWGIIVAIVTGTAGLVLGILNYIHQVLSHRPRLQVVPCMVELRDPDPGGGVIRGVGALQVTNHGRVKTHVINVGFDHVGGEKGESVLVSVRPMDRSDSFPCRLEPGEMLAVQLAAENVSGLRELASKNRLGRAWVGIATGKRFRCSKKSLSRFLDSLAEVPPGA